MIVKAINHRLLIVGLLALTGCKTETITESSFWQMLPFTSSKTKEAAPKVDSPRPVTTITATPKAAPPVVVVDKPKASVAATAEAIAIAKPTSSKKAKHLPPAASISLPVTPSNRTTQAALKETSYFTGSTEQIPTSPFAASKPLSLSDWIYDEKLHEDWRIKQLELTQEREPIHEYESAQLNRAFYNFILNEPAAEAPTASPKP
jgi:hypothetical protein